MGGLRKVVTLTDASGAVKAARRGLAVMIVDVIDMSTTLESALDAGASAVLGASPDFTTAPVQVNPYRMGLAAARMARENETEIVIVAEPRVGSDEERLARCTRFLAGVEEGKGRIAAVIPNLGAETPKLLDLQGRVVAAITDTGGVAYDAAYQVTPLVVTGTVARTLKQKGKTPAMTAAERGLQLLSEASGIAVVAASGNSLEDVLAARFIASLIRRRLKD